MCDQVLEGHGATVWALALNADGTRLATCDHTGAVFLWAEAGHGGKWARAAALPAAAGPPATLFDVAWAPGADGRLATCGADDALRVWAPADGADRDVLALRAEAKGAHAGDVNAVAWRPAGGDGACLLASVGDDELVRIWELAL